MKDLKKALKNLKSLNSDLPELKYVARTLRDKLRKKQLKDDINVNQEDPRNHDKHIEQNFWNYVKTILDKKRTILP